jgi:formylmethanofuran dehydrogenase subunit C
MSALTFNLKASLQQRLNVSSLTPDRLDGLKPSEIAALTLPYGRKQVRVDSVFELEGENTSEIVFSISNNKIDFIGYQMQSGSITVTGDAGAYAGFQMRNGILKIQGNADVYAASGMSGGLLRIEGNAGDYLGAAIPGDRKGMKGGTVIVSGNAGDRVGDQMRRGILLIEGNVGSYCASRMLAGTIGVLGEVGDHVGYGMRRGTLLLTRKPALHATLQDCGSHTLPFLSLMFKSFETLQSKFSMLNTNRVQRYAGDIANDGKGEILILQ